ncbi:MAG: PAS domain S-box protein, partial [candidate division Zixibacteria bacterium]|nr:PAS domain S-box protein [candidate division Zixibacteria bacterium]
NIIGSEQDTRKALGNCLKHLVKHTKADAGVVYLKKGESKNLHLIAHTRLPQAARRRMQYVQQVPYDKSPLQTGRTTLIHDFTETYPFLQSIAEEFKVKGFISIPLKSKNKVLGLIDLAFLRRVDEDEISIESLNSIGNQVGVALDNLLTFRQIREAENKYRIIYESSSDLLYTTDLKGNITSVNPAFEETIGAETDKLKGKKLYSLAIRGQRSTFKDFIEQSTKRKITHPKEIKLQTVIGDRIISFTAAPLGDDSGQILGTRGAGRDITDKIQIERALSQSEENFRLLAQNANDGILILHSDGSTVYANKRAAEITGYPIEELLDMKYTALIHPDELSVLNKRFRNRLKGRKEPTQYEARIIKKNGEANHIEITAARTVWQGEPAIIAVTRDITERKEAQDALNETLNTLSDVVHSIPTGLLIFRYEPDVGFFLIDGNPESEKSLNIRLDDYKGKEINELSPMFSEAEIKDRCIEVMRTGKTYTNEDFRHELNERMTILRIRIFRMHGQKLGFAFEDITERKRVEEHFRSIFNNTTIGLYQTTPDGKILMANPTLVKMLGYSSFEELANRDLSKAGYEPEYPRSHFKKLLEEKDLIIGLESAWLRRDKTVLYVRESARAVRDTNGTVRYFEGTVEDISKQKKATDALKESELLYRTTIDSMVDGIHVVNPELRFTLINDTLIQWNKSLGLTSEVIGKRIREVFPFLDEDVVKEYRKVFKEGKTLVTEEEMEISGENFVTETRKIPVIEGENVVRVVTVIRDITERKHSEEAVKESEERYRAIVESFEGIIYICSPDFKIEFINERGIERTGYNPIGEPCYKALHGLDDVCPWCVNERVLNGETVRWEINSPKDDRWYYVVNTPIFHLDGTISKQAMILDITERKHAEEALRQERDKAQNYLDIAAVMIVAIDENCNVTLINKTGCHILESKEDEIIGSNWFENYIPAEDKETISTMFKRMISGKIPCVDYFENPVVTKAGERRIIAWHNTLLKGEDGKIIGTLSSGEDITVRTLAERRLKETHEKYEKTVSSITDYLWSATIENGRWNPEFITPVFERITGYNPRDFMTDSMLLLKMVHPEDRSAVRNKIKELIKGKAVTYEHRILRKDGGVRWIHDRAIPTKDENGRVIRIDGVVSDITDRKEAEVRAEELRDRLTHIEQLASLGRMAAGVAHEINNPLSVISGMLQELTRKTNRSDPLQTKFTRMRKVADRIGKIVDGLLHFSRQSRAHFSPTDIHGIIEESLSMVKEKRSLKKIKLIKRFSKKLPKVSVERDQISQVIINLVNNAIDAMPDGGELTIETSYNKEEEYITINVKDTGAGISSEAKRKLFTPFYTTKPVGYGTGLGLAISYGIIRSHRGTIDVESETGEGSTFTIKLPTGTESLRDNNDTIKYRDDDNRG